MEPRIKVEGNHDMPIDAAGDSRQLREALGRYLRERPDAADTLVGIAQWWLPDTMRGIPMERLRLVLTELISANEVRCTVLPDGSELYSRAVAPASVPPTERDKT